MMHLQKFSTPDALSAAAASFILDIAAKAVLERGRFTWSLSGGRTPEKMFAMLAEPPYRDKMPWSQTLVFWGDERCVPYDDPRNNALMARKALLDKVDIPKSNIYPVPAELAPQEAARQYEQTLQDVFGPELPRFDLIMLGMGTDGHTASLFPGTAALGERNRWVCENFVGSQEMHRITFTFPLLNQARQILFLVTGTDKADVLKSIWNDDAAAKNYPARLVRPAHGDVNWYVDEDAAVLLQNENNN